MRYGDVEYLGIVYKDAEFVNGTWYFEQLPGEVYAFTFQERVKSTNDLQTTPRHRRNVPVPDDRMFGALATE